jgi:hypothetical protein
MASWPTEYDEVTCITAAELRWMGIAVPEDTPDVAWIPRAALRVESFKLTHATDHGATVHGTASVTFLTPFRWVECQVTIDPVESKS